MIYKVWQASHSQRNNLRPRRQPECFPPAAACYLSSSEVLRCCLFYPLFNLFDDTNSSFHSHIGAYGASSDCQYFLIHRTFTRYDLSNFGKKSSLVFCNPWSSVFFFFPIILNETHLFCLMFKLKRTSSDIKIQSLKQQNIRFVRTAFTLFFNEIILSQKITNLFLIRYSPFKGIGASFRITTTYRLLASFSILLLLFASFTFAFLKLLLPLYKLDCYYLKYWFKTDYQGYRWS